MGRPSAVVVQAIPQNNTGSAYVRDVSQDYDAFLYPVGTEGQPVASRIEAERLKHQVDMAMTQGLKVGDVYYSRTMRLPAFDYDGVPWNEGLPPGAEPYDYYPVSNWSVEVRPDPDDDTLYTVLVNLRLQWRVDGDTSRFAGATLQRVSVGYKGVQDGDGEPVGP
jgi:hypothetical protein